MDPIVRAARILMYEGQLSWIKTCFSNERNLVKPGKPYIAGKQQTITEFQTTSEWVVPVHETDEEKLTRVLRKQGINLFDVSIMLRDMREEGLL